MRANAFIGKDGLFSLDKNGQRRPFVFGKPLEDGFARMPPMQNAGIAVLDARLETGPAGDSVRKKYSELVRVCAAGLATHGVHKLPAGALAEMIAWKIKGSICPDAEILLELPVGRGADLHAVLVYDVMRAIGIRAGMSLSEGMAGLVLGRSLIRFENRQGRRVAIVESLEGGRKDRMFSIFDPAELQSELVTLAADERYLAGEIDKAVRLYHCATMICPESPDAHWKLGMAFYHEGKFEFSVKECRRAVRLEPMNSKAYAWLGSSLAQSWQLQEAIEAYEKAVTYAGGSETKSSYNVNLAHLLSYAGQSIKAIERCTDAISQNRANASAYLLRSDLYYEMGMNLDGDRDRRRYNELNCGGE